VPKKIKKTKIPQNDNSRIRATKLKPHGVSFSFKYFHSNHDKFCCHNQEISYWLTFIDRLKDLSGLTMLEMMNNRSSTLRCHPVRWIDTTEAAFGIAGEEQWVYRPCYANLEFQLAETPARKSFRAFKSINSIDFG
jgi:hypothetical protein